MEKVQDHLEGLVEKLEECQSAGHKTVVLVMELYGTMDNATHVINV